MILITITLTQIMQGLFILFLLIVVSFFAMLKNQKLEQVSTVKVTSLRTQKIILKRIEELKTAKEKTKQESERKNNKSVAFAYENRMKDQDVCIKECYHLLNLLANHKNKA